MKKIFEGIIAVFMIVVTVILSPFLDAPEEPKGWE